MIPDAPDRTLSLTRLIRAPRAAVWAAWTDPERLPLWWGPRGFTCRTHQIEVAEGGVWRFDMIGPEGTVYPNRHRFVRLQAPEAIDYVLDDDGTGSHRFDAFVRFAEVEGGTEVTLTMVFPDAATRAEVERFGAVAFGYTTLDCLAEAAAPGTLSVTRILPAAPDSLRPALEGDPRWRGTALTLFRQGDGTRIVLEEAVTGPHHAARLAYWGAAFDALEAALPARQRSEQ